MWAACQRGGDGRSLQGAGRRQPTTTAGQSERANGLSLREPYVELDMARQSVSKHLALSEACWSSSRRCRSRRRSWCRCGPARSTAAATASTCASRRPRRPVRARSGSTWSPPGASSPCSPRPSRPRALALAEEGTRPADAHQGVSDEIRTLARKHYDDDRTAAPDLPRRPDQRGQPARRDHAPEGRCLRGGGVRGRGRRPTERRPPGPARGLHTPDRAAAMSGQRLRGLRSRLGFGLRSPSCRTPV